MSKERLLSTLRESQLVERENNFDNERLKKIDKRGKIEKKSP